MEVRQLRYFAKVADLGSALRASRALHVAQPALSRQIAHLEGELGYPLFVRRPRGMSLTEQGAVFYRYAQSILRQLSEVKDALNNVAHNGHVTIGLPQSTAPRFAFPLLEHLKREDPHITIEFFAEPSASIADGLASGRLNLGVAVMDEDEGARSPHAQPLIDEHLFLVSNPGSAPGGRSIALEKLAELPLALPGPKDSTRAALERALNAAGLRVKNMQVEANSIGILRKTVQQGTAHSVMPWAALAEELGAGTLVATAIEPAPRQRAYVCMAENSSPRYSVHLVQTALIHAVSEEVRTGRWKGVRLA